MKFVTLSITVALLILCACSRAPIAPAERTLTVRVVDSDGRPLAGTRVWLEEFVAGKWLQMGHYQTGNQAQTNGRGLALLRTRSPNPLQVGAAPCDTLLAKGMTPVPGPGPRQSSEITVKVASKHCQPARAIVMPYVRLQAMPQQFEGARVKLFAFIAVDDAVLKLYPSREAYVHDDAASAISLRGEFDALTKVAERHARSYVIVVGTFHQIALDGRDDALGELTDFRVVVEARDESRLTAPENNKVFLSIETPVE